MKLFSLLCLLALSFATVTLSATIEEEEGVIVLTDENFDEVISSNEHVLVEFYAPWCGHCKALAPEYAKAAEQLASEGSSIKLAKLDATAQEGKAEEHEIRGYPTLKFFRSGTASEYTGGRTATDIVNWLKKKTGPPATTINNAEEAQAFQDREDKVVVLGLFRNADSAEKAVFEKAASNNDDVPFGISTASDVLDKYSVSGDHAVIVLQKFDEGRQDFDGEFTEEALAKFVAGNLLPLVIELSNDNAPQVFGSNVRSHLMVFLKKSADNYDEQRNKLTPVAQQFKGQTLVVIVNMEDESNENIANYFSITADQVPQVRLIQLGERELKKYKFEGDSGDSSQLTDFVQQFHDGKLKQFLKTEDVPEDWNTNPVFVLVGKNHDEVAFDTGKNVLVEYYAPWCGHCKKLAPIWDELGEAYKDDESVVIAKLDATANEIESVNVEGFPTIKFFPAGSQEIMDYNGGRTFKDFQSFIEKNAVRSEQDAAAAAAAAQEEEL